jgi:hypothetical protein
MVALLAIPLVLRYENSSPVMWGSLVVTVLLVFLILHSPKANKEEAEVLQKTTA